MRYILIIFLIVISILTFDTFIINSSNYGNFKFFNSQFKINNICYDTSKILLKKDSKINIAFLGDVMIWWRVREAIDKKWYQYVFSWTQDFLSKKDLLVLNLETSVTESTKKRNKTYTFKADKYHLSGLKAFNKKICVNLANNHVWDFWEEWMIDTINNLKEYNIDFFWLWNNIIEANKIKIIEIWDTKIWLIWQNCIDPISFKAWDNKFWTAFFDKVILKSEIKKARLDNVDLIVLNWHCWIEYSNRPSKEQIEYYHYAIDNGIDLVIWHHPHWYQWIEKYKWKIIFYSLGDYVFDIFRSRRTQEGIIADIFIKNKKIDKINLEAVHIYDYWSTKLATSEQKKVILEELQMLSDKLSEIKTIKDWYIEMGLR